METSHVLTRPGRDLCWTKGRSSPLKVCIVNPRFDPSFFGFDFALPLLGGTARYWSVTNSLPTLAGLVPEGCEVTLVDENVEEIDFAALRAFDVVGVTGMIVQKRRMLEILRELRHAPSLVVLGGPYVSVDEGAFDGLCDVRFIGEAEETWPAFLSALIAGEHVQSRYEQVERTDMTRVPVPRYDLLRPGRYMQATLQFSRGCPFQCEFCDIITIFGRRPRLKTPDQIIAELDAIQEAGFAVCFIVDDNFIGNRKEAKKLVRRIIEWQRDHGYPLQLTTEASINLADDAELIELMYRANFRGVFIGIESPRAASLTETKKHQNVRGDSVASKIRRVRDGGFVISAGFIVGFDNDDLGIFEDQKRFIAELGIGHAAVAILTPVPTTPLYDRLKAEGRLNDSDPKVAFVPKQMTQRELRERHSLLVHELYEPEAYLGRVMAGYASSPAFRARRAELERLIGRRSSVLGTANNLTDTFRKMYRLARALVRRGLFWSLAPAYLKVYVRENLRLGRERLSLGHYVGLLLQHWHFYNLMRHDAKVDFGNVAERTEPRAGSLADQRPLIVTTAAVIATGSGAKPPSEDQRPPNLRARI